MKDESKLKTARERDNERHNAVHLAARGDEAQAKKHNKVDTGTAAGSSTDPPAVAAGSASVSTGASAVKREAEGASFSENEKIRVNTQAEKREASTNDD